MAIALRYAARSDVGLVRSNNQDSGYAGPSLLVIADGMGGHAGGDVASSLAIGEMAPLDGESHGADAVLSHLSEAIHAVQRELLERVHVEPALTGMGTTVTALLRTGGRLALAHIGDSRAYMLREGRLAQITRDHTFVQRLVDDGRITEEEAEQHPQRSVLMRVLSDVMDDVEPDLSMREARLGDRYLLCSDGLSGVVSFETIQDTLAAGKDPATTCELFVQLALRSGAPDNVTCIVADVVDAAGTPTETVPVVVGAASLNEQVRTGTGSAAERAAELTAPTAATPDAAGDGGGAGDRAASGRRRLLRVGLATFVVILLIGGGAFGAYRWSQRQFFVGASDGLVAIFRGLPQDLGPVQLSSVASASDVPVAGLPPYTRSQVEAGIVTDNQAAAEGVVDRLRLQAAACRTVSPPSPTPSGTGAATSTAGPTPTSAPAPIPSTPTATTATTAVAGATSASTGPTPSGAGTSAPPAPDGGETAEDCRGLGFMAVVTPVAPRTGRNLEAILTACAVGLSVGAYALVGLAIDERLPPGMLGYGAGLGALALLLHLALRRYARYADPTLLPMATLINGISLVMIHRLDLSDPVPFVDSLAFRQLLWTLLGVLAATGVIVVLRDHRILSRYTYVAMVAGLALLLLPLLPVLGREINGARIWIGLGPLSFQPGELAKIALTVFFAGYLVTARDSLSLAGRKVLWMQLPRGRDLGPLLVAWGASLAVLVFERDLGTSLLFFGLFVGMLYIATERTSWVVIGLLLFGGGAFTAWTIFSHVQRRVDIWLHPFDPDILPVSTQIVQGLFGMANGGLLGTGLGEGRPSTVFAAESDMILASVGEELGLTGVFAILVLYGLIVERGLRTAIGVRDGFGKLLATGLAFTMALQVFVVAGGVTRVIPLTGLTMPFLAYGGSSLLANWMIVGLLLRISDSARRPAAEAPVFDPPTGDEPVGRSAEPPAGPALDGGRFDDQETVVVR